MNLHTLRRAKTALAMALCAAACSQFSSAQVAPPVILQIDLTNNVLYFQDTSDISKYATEPNVTPLTASLRNFYRAEGIADIVAVNGQPMKGTYANAAAAMVLRTAPTPGQAIADTVRQSMTVTTFEILKRDGTSIGQPHNKDDSRLKLKRGYETTAIVLGAGRSRLRRGQFGNGKARTAACARRVATGSC